jgi:hypothetical protein
MEGGRTTKAADKDPHLPDLHHYDAYLAPFVHDRDMGGERAAHHPVEWISCFAEAGTVLAKNIFRYVELSRRFLRRKAPYPFGKPA